jgi:pyruvate carboxylase
MKSEPANRELLFTYGSLRKGENHPVLRQVLPHLKYLGVAEFGGVMYDLGEYPGVIPSENPKAKIKGDLFEVIARRNDVFRALDQYEEYDRSKPGNSLFIRRRMPVKDARGKSQLSWIYLINLSKTGQVAKVISSGDYLKAKKKEHHAKS